MPKLSIHFAETAQWLRGTCHNQKFNLHLAMLNFILICLYALSGVCATIDTDVLNALQPHVSHSVSNNAHASTWTMQSLTDQSASVAITGKDNTEDHTHSLEVYTRGAPAAQAKVQFTPAKDGYVCEVSVHYREQDQLKDFKKLTLHTNSADFSVTSPTKTKVNQTFSVVQYRFPPCVDGAYYSILVITYWPTFPRFVFCGKQRLFPDKNYVDSAFSFIQC